MVARVNVDGESFENPLARFRTYSYHHILCLLSDTMNAGRYLLDGSGGIDMFTRQGTLRSVQQAGAGQYVILIDSRIDADFLIQELEFTNVFIPSVGCCSTHSARMYETDGEIKIFEPRGVQFLNLLAGACVALKVQPIYANFLLKTIFVGHNEDGSQEIIAGIRPFLFNFTEIFTSITEEGSSYVAKFTPNLDGATYNPGYDLGSEKLGIPIKKGQKLEEILQTFTTKLNEKYDAHMQAISKSTGQDVGKTSKIVYNIRLNSEQSKYLSQLDDFGELIPEQFKFGGQTGEAVIAGTAAGIGEHIHRILMTSKKLAEMTKGIDPAGVVPPPSGTEGSNTQAGMLAEQEIGLGTQAGMLAEQNQGLEFGGPTVQTSTVGQQQEQGDTPKAFVTYKIRTERENDNSGEGLIEYITYVVEEHVMYQRIVPETDTQPRQALMLPDQSQSVIEFDYIFTGKNTDIIDFDITSNFGLMHMINMASNVSLSDQKNSLEGGAAGFNAYGGGGYGTNNNFVPTGATPTGNSPLMMPRAYRGNMIIHQSASPVEPINNEMAWRFFASLSSLDVNLKIHGNPILLQQSLIPSANNTILRWTKVPAYAKINVKFPKYKFDAWEAGNEVPADFFEDFWYKDLYQIFKIKNSFVSGLFSQELHMVAALQNSQGLAESVSGRASPTSTSAQGGGTGGEVPRAAGAAPKNLGSSKNAETAMKYLMSKGYTPEQAAGIVGNLQAESGQKLNTGAIGDSGKALGIAQWHPDRQKGLMNYASQTGKDPYALETQLDWVDLEIKGQDAKYNGGARNGGSQTYSALMNAKTVDQATLAIQKYYERCKACGGGVLPDRSGYANNVYNRYGGTPAETAPTTSVAQTQSATDRNIVDASAQQQTPRSS